MKSMKITIKDGVAKIETFGFSGAECTKATEALSRALGKSVKDIPTHEMFEVQAGHEQEQR
jgi:hypothetical protein